MLIRSFSLWRWGGQAEIRDGTWYGSSSGPDSEDAQGSLGLLGRNALAGYLVHGLVADAVQPFAPRDAPAWYVWCAFAVYLGVTSLVLRHLDWNRLYLRL